MAGTRGGKASQPRTPPATKSKKRSLPESSPTNGDGEPKKKRGRPSKAEIAAREARQSQASENGNGASGAHDKMEGVIIEATKSGDAPMSPPATKKKRGRPSKADKEKSQSSIEESMDVDDSGEKSGDKNGDKPDEMAGVEAEKTANGTNGTNGDAQVAVESEKKPEDSNGHTEAKKTEERTNGANGSSISDGPSQDTLAENQLTTEKNAFDSVKSGPDEAPKPAENQKEPEAASDNTKSEEAKPVKPLPSNEATSEKEPEAVSDKKDVNTTQAATDDASKETTDPEDKNDTPVVDIGDDVSVKDFARQEEIPSSILEKGIIYFFFRSRVNVPKPQGIEDVARSYIVLRPLPIGAKITEDSLSDDGNARLLALPKKKLPQSGGDRFLVFVEKKGASIKELGEGFAGNQYATKTSGTKEPATPFAEGIYAITSTERKSHLAYHITVPEKVGEIQNELGIKQQGSFIVSAKNPENPGPGSANAGLNNPAKYPEELQKKFRNLKWMPLIPELLDYENTQFLVIGEATGHMGRALDEMSVDKKDEGKEKPEEEVEKLVEEDHDRISALKDDDPIFADLGLSVGEYPKLSSTWSGASV